LEQSSVVYISSASIYTLVNINCYLLVGATDKGGVVEEPVFRSIMFGLEGSEQSLFGTQDLYGGGWVFGQIHQWACGKYKG